MRLGSHTAATLTAEDAQAILAEVPRIQSVSLMTDAEVTVVSQNANWKTQARGISFSFLDSWWWTIAEGTAFTEHDVDEAEPVALIGRTVRQRLFGNGEAVGQDVRIRASATTSSECWGSRARALGAGIRMTSFPALYDLAAQDPR